MDRISFGDSARKKDFLFQLHPNEIDGLFTLGVLENKVFDIIFYIEEIGKGCKLKTCLK